MATSGNNDPEGYAAQEHERHLIHAEIELKQYNPATGEKQSQPRVQVFTEAEWKQVQDSGILEGYSVRILHKPSGVKLGNEGDLKREQHTGPLLGQQPEDKGPAGSVATTAGETLLQTTGSLEGDHKTASDTPAPGTQNPAPVNTQEDAPARTTTEQRQGLTPKQLLQQQYKAATGQDAPEDFTMVKLQEAIDQAAK